MKTYYIVMRCSNCRDKNNFEIPIGVRFSDFNRKNNCKCSNCGCSISSLSEKNIKKKKETGWNPLYHGVITIFSIFQVVWGTILWARVLSFLVIILSMYLLYETYKDYKTKHDALLGVNE